MTNSKTSCFRKVGHVVKGIPTNPFANLFEVYLSEECVDMTFEYYTTCNCCKTTEGVEMRTVGKEASMPLCQDCADVHKYANLATKAAKMQQAEDKLIGVVKGE